MPSISTITSPTAGSTVQSGHSVTIAGTVTDAGGGAVGGVEVSVDARATWHPATGREKSNPPLQALADGVSGGNGVYGYGVGGFPTQTYNASNYWVDVVFTTSAPPSTFTDTTVGDFSADTPDVNTYLAQTANGEVLLALSVGAEFFGTTLPARWTRTAWSTGGTTTVANGVLTVNGTRAGTVALFGPGRSLEFVATFSATANQNVGFGVDLNNPPWAMFSTRAGGSLSVQTRLGSTTRNTSLGSSWLGGPHRYRIEWNVTNIVYSIDGTVMATTRSPLRAACGRWPAMSR
jgi:hypothetical protein